MVKANGGLSTSYKRFPDAEEKELELIAAMVGVGVVLWGNSVVFTAETLGLHSWKREGKGTFMKVTFSLATSLLLENIQIVKDFLINISRESGVYNRGVIVDFFTLEKMGRECHHRRECHLASLWYSSPL